jgi:hypothetical protein
MLSLEKVRAFFFSQSAAIPSSHRPPRAHEEQQANSIWNASTAPASRNPERSKPLHHDLHQVEARSTAAAPQNPNSQAAHPRTAPDQPHRDSRFAESRPPRAMRCDSPILGAPASPARALSLWETHPFCAIQVHLVDSTNFPGRTVSEALHSELLPKNLALARMLLRTEKERERNASTSTRCRWKCGFQAQREGTKHVAFVSRFRKPAPQNRALRKKGHPLRVTPRNIRVIHRKPPQPPQWKCALSGNSQQTISIPWFPDVHFSTGFALFCG